MVYGRAPKAYTGKVAMVGNKDALLKKGLYGILFLASAASVLVSR